MTNKTQPTDIAPRDYIETLGNPEKREDAYALLEIIERLTGEPAKMWGPSIIGAGSYHYEYESGREGDFMLVGFAPRKREFVGYIMGNVSEQDILLSQIGKHKMGKSCIYFKRLSDLNQPVLEELMMQSIMATKTAYPNSTNK